jgi:hypothetical protein
VADPTPRQRQKELIHLVRQDCGSCHGMTLQGGLGPALLPANAGRQAGRKTGRHHRRHGRHGHTDAAVASLPRRGRSAVDRGQTDGRVSRNDAHRAAIAAGSAWLALLLNACAGSVLLRGTGDLGLVIERANGHVTLVNTSSRSAYARIEGLGDLSHASVVYSRDARYAFVFGRDGGLTKIDLLEARIVKRIMQSGNAIGGSISQDGRIVVAQNYTPGGIKAFDADTLELLAEVPAEYAPGKFSKVVGLADVPGNRFAYALFDGGEIWVSDFSEPKRPVTKRYPAGQQPYDGLVTPDGRHYLAGLFGEDGIALLDLWQPEKGARKILEKYGRGEEKLPVFKMPHLRGWSVAAGRAWLPAIGPATKYSLQMRRPGRRPVGWRSRVSRCSSWPAPTGARSGSISPSRITAGYR